MTAISATVGTLSMVAGGVVGQSDAAEFWRTWWLADLSGGLVVLPLALAWAHRPVGAWRRIRTWEGAAMDECPAADATSAPCRATRRGAL